MAAYWPKRRIQIPIRRVIIDGKVALAVYSVFKEPDEGFPSQYQDTPRGISFWAWFEVKLLK
jgi:hypothetical protein